MLFRRAMSSLAAHRLVQQRVQPQVALAVKAQVQPSTRVVFVSRGAAGAELQQALPFRVSAAALADFRAKPQEKMYLYPSDDGTDVADQRVLLVGLGAEDKVTEKVLRDATHGALSALRAKRAKSAVLHVPSLPGSKLAPARVAELLSQASMLSNYQFDQYRTPKKDDEGEEQLKLPLESIFLDISAEHEQVNYVAMDIGVLRRGFLLIVWWQRVTEQVTLGEETIFARNLGTSSQDSFRWECWHSCSLVTCTQGNERSDVVNPAFMEKVALASADLPNMSVRVLQQEDLAKEGMNMFLSVGQAATCPPRLVILEYRGNPDSSETVALVGKGITFDTGGLNLKPTGYIEDMHTDMCGSAAVLGAVRAASRLGLKVNIVTALALAENAIGSKAVKPHTIVKSHKVSGLRNTVISFC